MIDWAAGEVKTKLLGKNFDNPRAEPADVAVKGLIKDIGRENVTYGCRKHDTGLWLFTSVPVGPINRMMFKAMSKSHNETMAKLKEEGASLEEYD